LTSIRFLAAIAVVVSHYSELGLLNLPSQIFDFVDGGRPAVSLFFVLSGFILTFTYRDQLAAKGARSFYQARFARIYPVVLLGLALCVPTTLYLLNSDDRSLLMQWYALKNPAYLSLAASLVCQLLLLNAWFPFAAVNQPWNGPSDSVSCEAFFYMMFPLMLRKMMSMRLAWLSFAGIGLFLMQGLWIVFLQTFLPLSRSGFLVVGLPLTRLFEFVVGVYAAILFHRLREQGVNRHALGIKLVVRCIDSGAGAARPPCDQLPESAVTCEAGRSKLFALPHSRAHCLSRVYRGIQTIEWLDRDAVGRRRKPADLQVLRRTHAQAHPHAILGRFNTGR
jgi:peptidoglycan/LPS O-acetylase OafA/YrhL